MTSTTEEIEARWQALLAIGESDQREVDAASALRMLIGVSTAGSPYFAVITTDKPGQPDLGATVRAERRLRNDSRWVLMLELLAKELTDAFIALISEVAAKCTTAGSERSGLRILLDTLTDLQALLQARTDHITEERLRGLIAELWFGFQSDAHNQPLPIVVESWNGPFRAHQDFDFPSPAGTYEVKAARPTLQAVEISSAEQLDGVGVHLAVVTLDPVTKGGFTLPDQVSQIRQHLSDGPARREFNRRFAELFIDLQDPWYQEHAFSVQRLQIFDVRQEFPALRKSQLPSAIPRTTYRIDLQYVSEFLTVDVRYS